jgi:hypothetical protein
MLAAGQMTQVPCKRLPLHGQAPKALGLALQGQAPKALGLALQRQAPKALGLALQGQAPKALEQQRVAHCCSLS